MSMGGSATTASSEPSRVLSLQVSQSAYGQSIAFIRGKVRVPVNLMWYNDFRAERIETQTGGGGKGGGGASMPAQVSYRYSAAMIMGFSGSPISAVPRVFIDKEVRTLSELNLALYGGALGQSVWPYLTSNHPDEAYGYSGIAYLASTKYDLGDDPSSPQLNLEVVGPRSTEADGDAAPADVVTDLITDPVEGLGEPEDTLDLAEYRVWCAANNFTISLLADSQKPARDWLADIFKATLARVVDDDGRLRVVPLGDQPIGAWVPDTTPVYDITEHDLLEDPRVRRSQPSEAINKVVVEYTSRARDYATVPATAKDLTHINSYGENAETMALPCITRPEMASAVAEATKDMGLYQLSEVELRLDERFILLQEEDIITLTFAPHGLNRLPLRVKEVTISEDGEVSVLAREWPAGVASPAIIPTQPPMGYTPNYNVAPGNANSPVIFEPPTSLAGSPQVWLATSGGANWGGCEVWVSLDDATYSRAGVISAPARHGTLTATLPLASDPDNVNTLAVDVSVSGAQLQPVTAEIRDLFQSLCFVGNAAGGELIAYQGAALTGVGRYNLTNLRRGAYGSTIAAHISGRQFARLDGREFRYGYEPELVGKTLYIKLRSYNKFGGNLQDLADCAAIAYQVKGAPLGAVSGLVLESPFTGQSFAAKWNAYPGAQSYNLELWHGGALKKSLNTTDTRFAASVQQLVSWGVGRTVELRVVAVSANGQSSTPAVLPASKAQIAAPTVSVQDTGESMIVTASQSTDAAYKATRIAISQSNGFNPASVTPYYDGPQTAYPSGKIAAGTWYVRVAQYDQFGPDALNWTSQIALTVSALAVPLTAEEIADQIQAATGPVLDVIEDLDAFARTRPNLIRNGGFEAGLAGWSGATAGWAVDDGIWGRAALNTSSNGTGAIVSDAFLVQEGVWYVVTGDSLLFASAGAVYFDLLFYDGSGALLLDGPGNSIGVGHDFSEEGQHRVAHQVEVQAPSGAVSAKARFVWHGVSGLTIMGCRQIKAERGRLPATAYSSDKSLPDLVTRIASEETTRQSQYEALALRADTVEAVLDDEETGLAAAHARIIGVDQALTDLESSSATSIQQVNARLETGGDIKQALVQAQSTATVAKDRTEATWGITVQAGTNRMGIKAHASGETSALVLAADQVRIALDNLIADEGFYSPQWWSGGAMDAWPATVYIASFGINDGKPLRAARINAGATQDWWGQRINVTPGEAYRVRLRIFRSSTFVGKIFAGIRFPNVAWAMPGPQGAAVSGQFGDLPWHNDPASLNAWRTYEGVWTTLDGFAWLQTRIRAEIAAGYCEIALELHKAVGASLLVDGSVTAGKISVSALSAISAYLGTLIAGVVEFAGGTGWSGIIRTASKWWGDLVPGWISAARPETGDFFQEFRAANGNALIVERKAGGPNMGGAHYYLYVKDPAGVERLVIDPQSGTYKLRGIINPDGGQLGGLVVDSDGSIRSANYDGSNGFKLGADGLMYLSGTLKAGMVDTQSINTDAISSGGMATGYRPYSGMPFGAGGPHFLQTLCSQSVTITTGNKWSHVYLTLDVRGMSAGDGFASIRIEEDGVELLAPEVGLEWWGSQSGADGQVLLTRIGLSPGTHTYTAKLYFLVAGSVPQCGVDSAALIVEHWRR